MCLVHEQTEKWRENPATLYLNEFRLKLFLINDSKPGFHTRALEPELGTRFSEINQNFMSKALRDLIQVILAVMYVAGLIKWDMFLRRECKSSI